MTKVQALPAAIFTLGLGALCVPSCLSSVTGTDPSPTKTSISIPADTDADADTDEATDKESVCVLDRPWETVEGRWLAVTSGNNGVPDGSYIREPLDLSRVANDCSGLWPYKTVGWCRVAGPCEAWSEWEHVRITANSGLIVFEFSRPSQTRRIRLSRLD